MQLRDVNFGDIDLLYDWINDPLIRDNSYSPDFISYDEHKYWFQKKMDENLPWFISEINSCPIGVIRFDICENGFKINYSLDEKFRGQGLGQILIEQSLLKIANMYKGKKNIYAFVKKENIASVKSFISNGFTQEIHDTESYIFKKQI